jgi:prepilin-type processing-associated H-X9-DG protein
MAREVYPPGTVNDTGPVQSVAQGYHHNWISHVLPYIEQSNTYQHINFKVGVYDESNGPVRQIRISVLDCPSSPHARNKNELARTSYAGCHNDTEEPIDEDNKGVFFLNSAIRYEEITDGASHTIFIGEKYVENDDALGWMSGTRATLRNAGVDINSYRPADHPDTNTPAPPVDEKGLYVGGFGSVHPGGTNFAFGDGHVQFIGQTVALPILQQLAHRADGKLLSDDEF